MEKTRIWEKSEGHAPGSMDWMRSERDWVQREQRSRERKGSHVARNSEAVRRSEGV